MSGIRQGWVVRITGAGRSPGHEHVLALAAEGAQVAVTDTGKTERAVLRTVKAHCGTAISDLAIDSEGAPT